MSSKNPAQRLQDITDNISAIQAFTKQMDFATFCADQKTIYAVVRALEIVSEASRRDYCAPHRNRLASRCCS